VIDPLRQVVRTKAIGVVVPVHNEERLLASALAAIDDSFSRMDSRGIRLLTAIVLDGCTDDSAAIARRWTTELARRVGAPRSLVVHGSRAGVGHARSAGCAALLRRWRDLDPRGIWLASTDADSQVPPSWLSAQVEAHERGIDLWAGRVAVEDWSDHDEATASRWSEAYDAESAPIHGASLGVNAHTYLSVGGFGSLVTGEDRALYEAVVAVGANVHEDDDVKVITSGRRHARAPSGFSDALTNFNDGGRRRELIA
jgi:glycosyltransferase involved in cell wall biosynthesis